MSRRDRLAPEIVDLGEVLVVFWPKEKGRTTPTWELLERVSPRISMPRSRYRGRDHTRPSESRPEEFLPSRTFRSDVIDRLLLRCARAVGRSLLTSLDSPLRHVSIPPVVTHEDAGTVCAASRRRYDGAH